jgi:hypothetical protein
VVKTDSGDRERLSASSIVERLHMGNKDSAGLPNLKSSMPVHTIDLEIILGSLTEQFYPLVAIF